MIEIRITSQPRFLIVVRALVRKLCELAGCQDDEQQKIVLAVDEACSNIIRHTFHGDENQIIEISCKGGARMLEFELRDCGPPVNLELVHPRRLEDVRPGGLGTHFIHSIMDEVDYHYEEGCGNTLRMVKHLNKDCPQ
jgi:anti-sigma regulatory factor (Ser/Thr protein kinase)